MRGKVKKNYNRKSSKVQGVAYIESLLAILLFFALVGGILTMGIAVYRYVLLVNVVTQGVRKITVNPPTGCNSTEFQSVVDDIMEERFQAFGIDLGTGSEEKTFDATICRTADSKGCFLTVNAKWPKAIPCPFCILFKPGANLSALDLEASATTAMEEPDWIRCPVAQTNCAKCTTVCAASLGGMPTPPPPTPTGPPTTPAISPTSASPTPEIPETPNVGTAIPTPVEPIN